MFKRLLRRVFGRAGMEPPIVVQLGELEALARSGPAAWLLAQEKARLDFLAAQADAKKGDERAGERLLQKLLELQATTALIQSLVNEYRLEAMFAETPTVEAEASAAGRRR
jgi:hypothetical protein